MADWEHVTGRRKSNLERIKQGKYFKQMIDEGFVPFTKEWRHRNQYLIKKERLNDPLYRAKRAKERRERYAEQIEREREVSRQRKEKLRKEKRDEVNRKQREYYAAFSDSAAKQSERRHRREPNRLLRTATRLHNSGLLGDEQYVERTSLALKYADAIGQDSVRTGGRPRRKGNETPTGDNKHQE